MVKGNYYGVLAPRFARNKAVSLILLILCLAAWIYLVVFAGSDAVWSVVRGWFGVAASEVFVRILLVSVFSFFLLVIFDQSVSK